MERRLVATTVRHMDHAHERQSAGRSWHGRFIPGPEAQLAHASCTQLASLLIPSGERRGVTTRVTRWPSCRIALI